MGAKLTIISGSRQGQAISVRTNKFSVGYNNTFDLEFDLDSDPEAKGQAITITRQFEKWYLDNSSQRAIFVNHDVVQERTGLRSGDLIRLSMDGPDLLFELTNVVDTATASSRNELLLQSPKSLDDDTTNQPFTEQHGLIAKSPGGLEQEHSIMDSTSASKPTSPTHHGDNAREKPSKGSGVSHDTAASRSGQGRASDVSFRNKGRSRRSSKFGMLIGLISVLAGAVAGVSIAIIILWVVWQKDPLGLIAPVPDSADSSTAVEVTPSKRAAAPPILENPPTRRDNAPRFRTIGKQSVDLSKASFLSLDIQQFLVAGSDEDYSYELAGNSPKGIEIETEGGFLTWEIPPHYGGSTVPIELSLNPVDPNSPAIKISFDVSLYFSDTWDVLEQQVLKSAYLIVAKTKPGDRYLPLGTACAISEEQLMSSATVLNGIIQAREKGWSVVALNASSNISEAYEEKTIQSLKFHRMYLDAFEKSDQVTRRTQQAFYDIALIQTNESLESIVSLGQLNGGESDAAKVACIGFSVTGNLSSTLKGFQPELTTVDLLGTFAPEKSLIEGSRPPLLLELEGELPIHTFGGLIVNSRAEVLGVYGFEAGLDANQTNIPVHYASEALSPKLFIENIGSDLWVSDTDLDLPSIFGSE